jgi:catechol 2,3-dioxygenase-like lactoylglutathione lyase family enzyme
VQLARSGSTRSACAARGSGCAGRRPLPTTRDRGGACHRGSILNSLPSPAQDGNRDAPANTLGIRHIALAVDDIDAAIASLRAHGAELVGEVEQYEDIYRLCYVRGPEGIIVELRSGSADGPDPPLFSGHDVAAAPRG